MITKTPSSHPGLVRVTFELPETVSAEQVSLVGDFNGWDARATPLQREGEGANWLVVVELKAGCRHRFRYLIDGQQWLNDWYADDQVRNPYGSFDSVLDLTPVSVVPGAGLP